MEVLAAVGVKIREFVRPTFETVVAGFTPHQCQPAPTATIVNVTKNNHATGTRRRRFRSCGAATGGGNCARMPAHSAAGGSWP
ncbi:hypothetical protein [Hymenobacter terrigena]